ncbi:MAG: cell division protein ZapA [Lautropia sp.]
MDQLEVRILDRVFKLQVPTEERPRLMEAVRLVDGKMREIRDSGKASGLDRIAVNAALQLAYEFLGRDARPAAPVQTTGTIRRITDDIDAEIRRQESLF